MCVPVLHKMIHCTFFTLESQRDHFNLKKKNQNINFNRFFYNVEDTKKKKEKMISIKIKNILYYRFFLIKWRI